MKRRVIEINRFVVLVVLLIGLIGLQGCATAPVPKSYFGHNIELKQDPKDASLLWWEKPRFNWHRYSKLMLDPVEIRIEQKTMEQKFDPKELTALGREFTEAVLEELEPEYPVVISPGPDVLRIRAAIIDIDTSNPVINLATTLAVFVPLDMGGAAIAVEFFDSETGEQMAAMVDRKTGTPLQLISGFKKYGHAQAAFDKWSEELKLALKNNP